jgi:uncharacterized membrane protein YgdD (TMEM256/DUF423 family)
MRKKATVFASISGCIAVILGALGAHALSSRVVDTDKDNAPGMISTKILHAYETATHYQLLHSVAIIAIVALFYKFTLYFKPIMYLMIWGIVLFSGSIYLLVIGDLLKIPMIWAGPITPLGGLCLIAAWFLLFLSALKFKENPTNTTQNQ